MPMVSSIIYFLIILQIENIESRIEEFNICVDLERNINSSLECTNIKIPDLEEYKCCSMKIIFNQESSYNCFALETKYAKNQETLNEYISSNNVSFLFTSMGGKVDIDCGYNLTVSETYNKLSDDYLNCYNNHINSIENEYNCTLNDIPDSKCCFVQTSTQKANGKIINDKRCYMIQNEYFSKKKNLNNYLLDESNNNLNEYNNTNITIKCKNYDTFFFSGSHNNIQSPIPSKEKSDIIEISDIIEKSYIIEKSENIDTSENVFVKSVSSSKKSGIKAWKIILIIIGVIFCIGIIIVIIAYFKNKKKSNIKKGINEVSTVINYSSSNSQK